MVSVEWGYETHSMTMLASEWAAIQRGEASDFSTTGWYEGKSFEIQWYFNAHAGVRFLWITGTTVPSGSWDRSVKLRCVRRNCKHRQARAWQREGELQTQ